MEHIVEVDEEARHWQLEQLVRFLAYCFIMVTMCRNDTPSSSTPTVETALDILTSSLLDILNFHECVLIAVPCQIVLHRSTYVPLDRGLYLCYVKMHSSMNDISVVVPENLPSVLPFVYVRDNPHVCRCTFR